jgi:hypothetical protein
MSIFNLCITYQTVLDSNFTGPKSQTQIPIDSEAERYHSHRTHTYEQCMSVVVGARVP